MTLYDILEVSPSANKDVIQAAYKALAKRHHPDLNPPELKEQCTKNMNILNEARRILCDDELRRQYDLELANSKNRYNVSYDNEEHFEQNTNENVIDEELFKPRPWTRYFGRMIDLFIYGILSGLIIYVVLPKVYGSSFKEMNKYVTLAVGQTFAIFIEAILLSIIGTTPGKWVLNSKVVCRNGGKLNFSSALKRTLLVYFKGMAFGIPILSTIALIISYRRLSDVNYNGLTEWDIYTNSAVISGIRKPIRIVTAVVIVVFTILGSDYYTNTKPVSMPIQEVHELEYLKDYLDNEYKQLKSCEVELNEKLSDIENMDNYVKYMYDNGSKKEYEKYYNIYTAMIEEYEVEVQEYEKRYAEYNRDADKYNKKILDYK